MSILTLAYPAQAAMSVAQAFSGSVGMMARSVVGLSLFGVVATLTLVFKPLIMGLLRTTQLVMQPRASTQQRYLRLRVEGAQMLARLAKEAEATQPTLAAEMRYLAARG